MDCIGCCKPVEPEREEFGLTVCRICAHNGVAQPEKKLGYQVYDGKTGDQICVVDQDAFDDMRRLNPYGKYTGMGSGVHVITKTTAAQ